MDDSVDSTPDLTETPTHNDLSFLDDSNMFSGDQSVFIAPGTDASQAPGKRKKQEEDLFLVAGPTASEIPMKKVKKGQSQVKEAPSNEKQKIQAKEDPPKTKELIESQMKEILNSLMSLEDCQVEGGNQLLSKATTVHEEVSAYKQKLTDLKLHYKNGLILALECLSGTAK